MNEDKTTKLLVRVIATIGIAFCLVGLFFIFLLKVKSGDESLFSSENIAQAIGLFGFALIVGVVIASRKIGKGEVDDK